MTVDIALENARWLTRARKAPTPHIPKFLTRAEVANIRRERFAEHERERLQNLKPKIIELLKAEYTLTQVAHSVRLSREVVLELLTGDK